MKDFKELKVWQKAHQLTLKVYRCSKQFPSDERFGSKQFPSDERFGLTAHLCKTATSIPSNIAEGCGREGDRELARFLTIATGSASELEYQLLLAQDLNYLPADSHTAINAQVCELRRMLYRFVQSLK